MKEEQRVIAMSAKELDEFFDNKFEGAPVDCKRAIGTLMSMYMDTQDYLIDIGEWQEFLEAIKGSNGAVH
jgi:hypothetical protein